MFDKLSEINARPEVFSHYTAEALWADPYRARQMLALHLNPDVDVSSRNAAFIARSSAWMIDQFSLGADKSVCDFGCGPGLYTSKFADAGARVTGVDFSETSLGYARSQAAGAGQSINYVHANYLAFETAETFDLITMIMCDFCALSPAQRRTLLGKFRGCLKDGGAVVLDVYSLAAYAAREEVALYEKNQLGQFWAAEDYYCFLNTFKYDAASVVLDKYNIFHASGAHDTVYNWLQYFSPQTLSAELAGAGFEVRHLLGDVGGGSYDEAQPEFAVVAVKAA